MARAPWLPLLLLAVVLGSSASFLSAAAPSETTPGGECGFPEPVENAQMVEGGSPEKRRYSCLKNYKRKAGTSSLILCKQDNQTKKYQWTKVTLICIRDPSLPPVNTSRGEATTSTPADPKTTAVTALGTDGPSPDTPTMAPPTAVGLGQVSSPDPVTQSSTWPQGTATSPVLPARTSETLKAGSRSTAAPSETSIPGKLTGSLVIRIGLPLLVVLVFMVFVFLSWWRCFQRQNGSQRQGDLRLPEEIPVALMASKEGADPGDPLPASEEEDPFLASASATSTR